MNSSYGLILFGAAFFGFMMVVSVVQARRKKEKAYYLAAVIGLMAFLIFAFAFLNQLVLAFIFMIATCVLSVAGLPKMLEVQKRELAKQLQKANLSAPLRVKDIFTTRWWLKLASTLGLLKTICLYYLLSVVIIGGILFILSTFYRFVTIGYVASYTATVSIFITSCSAGNSRRFWKRNEDTHGILLLRSRVVNPEDLNQVFKPIPRRQKTWITNVYGNIAPALEDGISDLYCSILSTACSKM